MGFYTELIFGPTLKIDTPDHVIETLRFMGGEIDSPPNNYPFSLDSRLGRRFLVRSSYCSAVSKGLFFIEKDMNMYTVSARCSLKNYENEIEKFLNWIKPWIDIGSGQKDFYAIVIDEKSTTPTIYYLDD